jgi:hypothetical protein
MNIKNAKTLHIKTISGKLITATRINDVVWELQGHESDRKDRFNEDALSNWIDSPSVTECTVSNLRDETITIGVSIEGTEELDKLQEKLMALYVTTAMLKAGGIDLGAVAEINNHIQGEGVISQDQANMIYNKCGGLTKIFDAVHIAEVTSITNPDADMIEGAKSVKILNSDKVFSRKALGEGFECNAEAYFNYKEVIEACKGQRVLIEMFPKQERHDYIAKKYNLAIGGANEASKALWIAKQNLQKAQDKYEKAKKNRADLYKKMKALQ